MLSKRMIERLAGALLLASFLAFLAHIVTLKTMGPGATTILCVLVYGFLVGLAAAPLYVALRSHESTLALSAAHGFAAHGLFAVLTCALLLAGLEAPEEFAATFGAAGESAEASLSAIELSMDRIRTITFLFLGLGLVPLGVLIARGGAVARWVGWLGLVAGIGGFLGLFAALFKVASIHGPVAVVAQFLFLLVLGVRLLVWEARPASA